MDIASLKVFQTAAKAGSISKAAHLLNYAQSNVTTKIRQLEEELQATLFYRHNRGITPTPAGKMLLGYAEAILHLCEEARRAIQDPLQPAGPLVIGSMETTAAVRLPPLLSRYHQMYPNVELSIVTGTTEQHIHAVLHYGLDGAFVAGPIEHPELEHIPIFEEELVLVTSTAHPPITSPGDLASRTLLVFRNGCSYRARFVQWLHEEGVLPVKVMEFGTLEGIVGCVAAGLGVTLLPRAVVRQKEAEGTLRCHAIPPRHARVFTVFVRRRDALVTKAMEAFLSLAAQGTDTESNQREVIR